MPKPGFKAKKKYSAVGAYVFAGGFTVGVKNAGFNVRCHLEESDYGVETFKKNVKNIPVYDAVESWPLDDLAASSPDFVYGNPPCAAWSVAGYTKHKGTDKWKTDPRVACTERYFGLLAALEPIVWVWESVTQAWTKGREFVMLLAAKAASLGYSTTLVLHDAQYLGLPQVRKRFFMVCHRVAVDLLPPDFDACLKPIDFLHGSKVGVASSGKSMIPIRRFDAKMLAKVLPGERLTKFWMREIGGFDQSKWKRNSQGNVAGRPSFGHCRLPLDRPCGAVVGYGMVHPVEHRWLSTEEMQLLSGFPSDYEFTPTRPSARASEIARGVCPPVAEWLAKSIRQSLNANIRLKTPSVTLVNLLKPGIASIDLTHELKEV